jgi:hypothetical protein
MARHLHAGQVMQTHIATNPSEVPDDVRTELGQLSGETRLPPRDAVPDDTRGELDREARLADAELHLELTEGQLPADADAQPPISGTHSAATRR